MDQMLERRAGARAGATEWVKGYDAGWEDAILTVLLRLGWDDDAITRYKQQLILEYERRIS